MTASWVLHRAVRDLRRHRLAALVLGVGFCTAVVLGGGYRLTQRTAARVAPALRDGIQVIAYLRDDVGPGRAVLLREALDRLPDVRGARLVTSEEALARMRTALGATRSLLDGVEEGFLPPSIEVALNPAPGVAARARQLAARLRKLDGIAEVDAMESGIERLGAWLSLAGWLGTGALALAVAAALASVALAAGIGRERRRGEAEILAWLGQTRLAAGLPAGLAGAVGAAMGAAAGIGILYAGYRMLISPAQDALAPLLGGAPGFLPAGEIVLGVAATLVLGSLAGMMAARWRDPIDAPI